MNTVASEPRLNHVACLSPAGLHRMAYWEWGDPDDDRVLLCVHGLTRTGRDFDAVARRLSAHYRVVCPDVVGRGQSDWLGEPAYYAVPQYVADMNTLIARLAPRELHWFGTSMGGLIGMTLGGLPGASAARRDDPQALLQPPITRMLINDIGPVIDLNGMMRIASYASEPSVFASFDEAVAYLRRTAATFGEHTDAQWRALAEHTMIERDGQWIKHYDPALTGPLAAMPPGAAAAAEAILWRAFEGLRCPTLLVRGAQSDLLHPSTLAEMLARNPQAQVREIAGVGHAPTFLNEAQIDLVEAFFLDRS